MRIFNVKGFPVPRGKRAITIAAWIFTKSKDAILIAHECVHIEQFKAQPFAFWLRYLFSKQSRFEYEAEAYAVSVNKGMNIHYAGTVLSRGYALDKTTQESIDEIKKYLGAPND